MNIEEIKSVIVNDSKLKKTLAEIKLVLVDTQKDVAHIDIDVVENVKPTGFDDLLEIYNTRMDFLRKKYNITSYLDGGK